MSFFINYLQIKFINKNNNPTDHNINQNNTDNENSKTYQIRKIWLNYKPLVVILIISLVIPLNINYFSQLCSKSIMTAFMGYFFIFLSVFKFFNIQAFVEGFSNYDLITKYFKPYGYLYPFIEFFLGIAYVTNIAPFFINLLTTTIMLISGVSVLKSILSGSKFKCACLGSILNVPLSTIAVIENFGMGLMSGWLLFF